jgi:uncharacterized cupin superfamily protein
LPTNDAEKFIVRATTDPDDRTFRHPLNPHAEVHIRPLSRLTGMSRLGVSQARVPPGKESFIYHTHHCEEEFIYILSGRGVAEIGDQEYEVAAGDFMAFPTPSVGHHLRNPFDEDLVYLTGGENRSVEIADFPRIGKRMYRTEEAIDIVDHQHIEDWPPNE